MSVKTTLMLFLGILLSYNMSAQCSGATFEEENGIAVIQAENVNLTGAWRQQSGNGSTGNGYITWTGSQSFQTPGTGTIQYTVRINNPGTYRFKWRSRVGEGNSSTEHNDTWLRIQNVNDFYGLRGNSRVYPRGSGKSPAPEGASSNNWFKIYMNNLGWDWRTVTSDFDAHDVYFQVNSPRVITIQLSARSRNHFIDRMVIYKENQYSEGASESLSRAQTICDGSSNPPPPPPPPPGGGDDNNAPTVNITNPDNGESFTAGSSVTVQLNANDSDGSIAQHQIFLNGNLVDTDGANYTPYTIQNLASGNYTIRALVTDNDGATDDATVSISVGSAPPPSGGGGDDGGDEDPPASDGAIESLTLVNTANNANIANITNGLTLDKSNLPASLSIRANTSSASIGNINFTLSGPINQSKTEGDDPYYLFGDIGVDPIGRNFPPGTYSITAQAVNGNTLSYNFTITDNGDGDGGGDNPPPPPPSGDSGVVRLVLVNAANNTEIGVLTPGIELNADDLPNSLSIRADTDPVDVGNVLFDLSGPISNTQNEGLAPYYVFGDIGVDPVGRSFPNGNYTVTANPSTGQTLSLSFSIVSGGGSTPPPADDDVTFTLIDANSNQVVRNLTSGTNISSPFDRNIRVTTTASGVESVLMVLNGAQNRTQTENLAPYALFGDNGGNYNANDFPNGSYTLTATFYAGPNASGSVIARETLSFTTSGNNTSGKTSGVLTKTIAYPNPVQGREVNLKFPIPKNNPLEYRLISSGFQVLGTGTMDAQGSDETNVSIQSLEQAPSGIYYLIITDGVISESVKIIKE